MTQIKFPQFPQFINIHRFTNVLNSSEIKENLIKGNKDYDFAFINTKLIFSQSQLYSAIYRSLLELNNNNLRTKNIHSEILFCLSPINNIMEALKNFGIQNSTFDFIVIKISDNLEIDYNLNIINGEEIKFEQINNELIKFVDLKKLYKIYKLGTFKEVLNNEDILLINQKIINSIQLRGQ
ncbi:hypothetical protein WICMUC_001366 [Wickerhamomyces mucosus]|uniref:EKC/KEOPS complex subunit CGI121 n=1 Tax=Wickerhamomyces mucosus TaxID=1378264 RepID=A0A9P8PUC4_9ASCO|nr:hypothetical protein WICMUC_001366 [Wickerhamomyces mucosus]